MSDADSTSQAGGRRLQGSYGLAVAIALLGLCPNIVITTAFLPVSTGAARDLHSSPLLLQIGEAMSNAGYAFGAVAAAQLAQRFVQRRLFLGYEAMFVVGSVLAASSPGIGLFFAGRVLQGVATGFMLVSALPPLVTRFGVGKLPGTVVIVNIGLFGATAVGPLVGGVAAQTGAWREMLGVAACLGLLGLLAAQLGYPHFAAPVSDLPVDASALILAAVATVLPFFATSVLAGTGFASPLFLVPFLLGLAALAALVVLEYRKHRPLMPVQALSTQLPVTGTVVAMVAGAVFVTVVELMQTFAAQVAKLSPVRAGTLFWAMPVGLLLAAALFGLLFRTSHVPVLVDVGLGALVVAALLLFASGLSGGSLLVDFGTFLLGFGAGATVSPGLFLAAFGVPSEFLGRAFALVELLRSEAAYAVTPIVLYLAEAQSSLGSGVRGGLLAMVGLAVLGLALALGIPALSGARLRKPDLDGWLNEGRRALPSPVTVVHVRPRAEDESAEPLLPRRRRREDG